MESGTVHVKLTADAEPLCSFLDAASKFVESVKNQAEYLRTVSSRETHDAGEALLESIEDFRESLTQFKSE